MNRTEISAARFLMILLSGVMFLLAACSSGKKDGSGDIDTEARSEGLASESTDDSVNYYLTADSIGPIRIGMEVNEIPKAANGLYTNFMPQTGMDSQDFMFYDNGKPVFLAMDFGQGAIDVINVTTPHIGVKTGKGEIFHVGDVFSRLINEGAAAEWIGFDGEGMWSWHLDGIWFLPDTSGSLPPAFSSKLYNPAEAPEKDDFTDSVKIGYMGTGLPI